MLVRAERKPPTLPARAARPACRLLRDQRPRPCARDRPTDATGSIQSWRGPAGRAQRATLQRYIVKPALSVKGSQFEGQVRQGTGSFRNNQGTVVVQPGPNNTPLRVSEDGKMAIEDSDLNARQPKVFYATSSVMTGANKKLVGRNSEYELYTALKNAVVVDNQAGKSVKRNKIMARRRVRGASANNKGTKVKAKQRTADDLGLSLTVKGVCGDVASAIVGRNVSFVAPKLKQARR